MTRSILTAAVVFVLFSITRAGAADSVSPFPHIRSNQPELLEAVDAASRVSPTFRRLADRLSASDVIVYLHYRMASEPGLAGTTSFMTAAGGVRYLRVSIDPRLSRCQRFALLGHELQHAVEIADAHGVVDQRSFEALYRKVGFQSPAACARCFESAGAIAAGQRIQREVLTGRHDLATR